MVGRRKMNGKGGEGGAKDENHSVKIELTKAQVFLIISPVYADNFVVGAYQNAGGNRDCVIYARTRSILTVVAS